MAAKPVQTTPEPEKTSCPSVASLGYLGETRWAPSPTLVAYSSVVDDVRLPRVAQTSTANGLYIGGQQIVMEQDSGLQSFLDQSPRRKLIFQQMTCNRHRRFEFGSPQILKQNILIREQIIDVVKQVDSGKIKLKFASSSFVLAPTGWLPFYNDPNGSISIGGRPLTWKSQLEGDYSNVNSVDTSAHAAIESFVTYVRPDGKGGSALDCLTALEMVVLTGVERAVGPSTFDQIHPMRAVGRDPHALYGIGVPILSPPDASSLNTHLIPLRSYKTYTNDRDYLNDASPKIVEADLILGDYVYMQNLPSYQQSVPNGAWAGENALYVGKGTYYGFGVGYVTEDRLQQEMANAYNRETARSGRSQADASKMRWTLQASPVARGNLREAGPYVD